MFSIPKLIALAGIVAAVWYGFRFISRLDNARKAKIAEPDEREAASTASKIEDLVECKTCGAFVAQGSKPGCGQGSACPFA